MSDRLYFERMANNACRAMSDGGRQHRIEHAKRLYLRAIVTGEKVEVSPMAFKYMIDLMARDE